MTGLYLALSEAWWEWCAAVSWQVAVLVAAVFVLDRLLRRWLWPEVLAALWCLVTVKLLLPPSLASPVGLSNLWTPEFATLSAPPEAPGGSTAAMILFPLWAAGSCLAGLAGLWRRRGLRRHWLGDAPERTPAWLETLAGEAATAMGLRRAPEVIIQRRATGPAVVGIRRPVVVLPLGLVSAASVEEIRHVLLHEFAHVRRRDPLLQALSLAVQIPFWFHPFLWLARRRQGTLIELCCDRAAAAAPGGGAGSYRRTLIRLARPMLGPVGLGGLGLIGRRSQLLLRIDLLEDLENLERHRAGRSGRAAPLVRRAVTAGLCGLVLVSCVPLAATPAVAEEFSMPPLESLRGCLQLRYAVQAALWNQQAANESHQPPNP